MTDAPTAVRTTAGDAGFGRPFQTRRSKFAAYVPGFLRNPLVEAGGMAMLGGQILWSIVRRPTGFWNVVLDDMYDTIKRAWLPIAAALLGFLMFMAVLVVLFFDMVGATHLYGPVLLLQSMRSFTMWIDSIVVAGVIGTALTADLGARRVREEIDAMEVMGVDPVRDLALPKVVSITLITTLMSVPSLIVTILSMQLGGIYVAGLPSAHFYSNLFSNVQPIDLIAVVINSMLIGLLIGIVCCYKGFHASGGAIGLGRAVNQAVVVSFVSVWILQLAYQALVLGLFPNLGSYR